MAGAINRKVNSNGSVMPVTMEVSAADSSRPATTLRFCGACGAVHGQRRAGQAEDHKDEFAGHKAGRIHRKFCGRFGGKFGKEDVLRACTVTPSMMALPPTAVCQNGM